MSGRRLAPGGAGGGQQAVLEAVVVEPKTCRMSLESLERAPNWLRTILHLSGFFLRGRAVRYPNDYFDLSPARHRCAASPPSATAEQGLGCRLTFPRTRSPPRAAQDRWREPVRPRRGVSQAHWAADEDHDRAARNASFSELLYNRWEPSLAPSRPR